MLSFRFLQKNTEKMSILFKLFVAWKIYLTFQNANISFYYVIQKYLISIYITILLFKFKFHVNCKEVSFKEYDIIRK